MVNNFFIIHKILIFFLKSLFGLILTSFSRCNKYSIKNKNIAVIGSTSPWLECIALNFGAEQVTTVEYIVPKVNYPKLKAISYYKDFKNYSRVYKYILERCQNLNAWFGTCHQAHNHISSFVSK